MDISKGHPRRILHANLWRWCGCRSEGSTPLKLKKKQFLANVKTSRNSFSCSVQSSDTGDSKPLNTEGDADFLIC